jgi:argininosuccinate lyase
VSAATVLLVGLGRVVQDLLLWCTAEVGYLRLSDGFVQCSSIMPQKRNPVALEHARAIASKAVGQATAVVLAVHNTPFGDIVDTEDDLQPLVSSMFRDGARAIRLVTAAMSGRSSTPRGWPSVRPPAGSPSPNWPTPWRASTACLSGPPTPSRPAWCRGQGSAQRRNCRRSCARCRWKCWAKSVDMPDDALARVLSPRHFVEVRKTPGGPAPSETARAIAASRLCLAEDDASLKLRIENLRSAERELAEALKRLQSPPGSV